MNNPIEPVTAFVCDDGNTIPSSTSQLIVDVQIAQAKLEGFALALDTAPFSSLTTDRAAFIVDTALEKAAEQELILASTPESRELEAAALEAISPSKDPVKPIKYNKNANRIAKGPAKQMAEQAIRQRVSRRLQIANNAAKFTSVCDVTGIVCLLDIPNIPFAKPLAQKIMVWNSPLADLRNARGLAQGGLDYLRRLDTQTLAGILIVLADDYELFRYQPSDSAAQKNAVIRGAGKDCIIDAILLIEDYLHNKNNRYVPKLSLILEPNMLQGAITARMSEWLKVVREIIYAAPTEDDEDTFYSQRPKKIGKPQLVKDQEKATKAADWAKLNAQWAVKREFKADKKAAKELIPEFAKNAGISLKLKTMLMQVFSEDTLLTLQPELKALLCNKLSDFTAHKEAASLIALIKKPRNGLVEEFTLEGLEDDLDSVAPVGVTSSDAMDSDTGPDVSETVESDDESEDNPQPEGTIVIDVFGVDFYVNEVEWNKATFVERMLHKKQLKAANPDYYNADGSAK